MIRYIPFQKYHRVERRLRKLVRSKSATARRDALAITLGLHGLRVTEVVNLLISDLEALDQTLLVQTLKGGKPRRVALGPGVFKHLRRLAGKRPKTARLFATAKGRPVADNWLQKQARRVTLDVLGGEGLRFHGGRHTYAMRLWHETRDMQRVKSRLGHRSISSTQVYVDAYGELDDDEIRKIGKISVLPNLVVRKRKRTTTQTARAQRNTHQKTHVSLGKQNDSHEMAHGKNGFVRFCSRKAVAHDAVRPSIRLCIHRVGKGLGKPSKSVRRSG